MTNQNKTVKTRAFFALTAIRPTTETVRPVLPTLMQALGDPEWTMRLAALNALAALQPALPETTSVFVRLLQDPNGMVSDAAVNYLVAQTNPVVLPMLDKQLNEKDDYIVTVAASHLGTFGPGATSAVPRLKQLLNAPMITVRQAASNALAAITGQPLPRSTQDEKADVTFNMPGLPWRMGLDMYEELAGKKVKMKATPKNPGQILRVITARPMTKNEALTLLEEILKEQAGLIIVHEKDGSLTAVAKPNAE